MTPVLVIAASTIREHSRRKLILFFAIISAIITAALAYFAADSQFDGFLGNDMLAAISGFYGTIALIAALATSMGNIGRPFNSGEALLLLARPVSRAEFVLGRFAAGIAVTWALSLLFAAEMQAIQLIEFAELSGTVWKVWGVSAFNLAVVAAITTLLSAFISTPAITAVIAYLVNQVVGVLQFLDLLVRENVIKGGVAAAIRLVWLVTPKFLNSPFARARVADGGVDLTTTNSIGLGLWALAWLIGLLGLSILFTARRDV